MADNTASDALLADEEYQSIMSAYLGSLLTSSLCSILLIILLLLDAWKAFKRKAHWIPGHVLILSALTIQVITYIVHLNLNVNSKDRSAKDVQIQFAVCDQILTDCRRVMICVFIAYLIPGMVRRSFRSVWSDIGALIIGVIFHTSYDVYNLLEAINPQYGDVLGLPQHYRRWLIASCISLSIVITLLLGLLISAVIAGKTISKLMSQKVPLAISCCCGSPEKSKCKNIEDHVLKCWIVLRTSQPEYIIARSVLSASAGVLVAVCVVLLVFKWTHMAIPKDHLLQRATYCFQIAFVLVGSLVVVMRWLTAVFYFPRDVRWLFYREDFWTRSLVELKEDRRWRGVGSLLFSMALWVQKLIVSLSKLSWCLSEIVFAIIRPFTQNNISHDQFSQHEEALEIIRMPGETSKSLWIANERAFKQIEDHMKEGIEKGIKSSYAELINLMRDETGPPEGEATPTIQEEQYFKEIAKKSWKMRGVSLIHFMMFFYDGTNYDVVNEAIVAYSQALEFMDFVDNSVPEAKLVSLVADKEFRTLMNLWKKLRKMQPLQNPQKPLKKSTEKRYQLLETKIKRPLRENMEQLSGQGERNHQCLPERNHKWDKQQDSMDWKKVAANISLYQIEKVVNINSNPVDAIQKLRCLLANIIVHCMGNELDRALLKNCNEWAKHGKEKEIFDAAFIAGKSKGVRHQRGQGRVGGEGKHAAQDLQV